MYLGLGLGLGRDLQVERLFLNNDFKVGNLLLYLYAMGN